MAMLSLTAAALALLGFSTMRKGPPLLVWNGSASAPLGLYIKTHWDHHQQLNVGDWVLVKPTVAMQQLIDQRHYLPPHIPMIKQVRAVSGQHICRTGVHISIDGQFAAKALTLDYEHRPMPIWQRCNVLKTDEVFLLQPHPRSFDGRYFGAVSVEYIIGKYQPLWITK